MDEFTARRIISACHEAHQIEELLPELPAGMTPQYVRILDIIHELNEENEEGARISDIGARMGISLPGITRSIRFMEQLGAVAKKSSDEDRRVVLVVLTEKGREWYRDYVGDFYRNMAAILEDISDEEARTMIDVVHHVHEAMFPAVRNWKKGESD